MPLKYYRILSLVAFLVLAGWFIVSIQSILLPFVFGILIAYFFDPTADRLQRAGFGRTAATALILISFFTIVSLALIALLPLLAEQITSLISEIPMKVHAVQKVLAPYINRFISQVGDVGLEQAGAMAADFSGQFLNAGSSLVGGVVRSGLALANLAALLIIAPVVSFYLLRDWDEIMARLDMLLPRYYAETIREQFLEMDRVISGFFRGQLKVCAILALFYAVALGAAGLKYSLLIGLCAGLLVIVPYAGTFISGFLAIAVALLQFENDPTRVGVIAIIFVIGQMLEGYILTPRLIGNSVGLHPMWIIFGMLAGGTLMGFLGVMIAIPLTAVIGVLVRFSVRKYLNSPLYASGMIQRVDVSA